MREHAQGGGAMLNSKFSQCAALWFLIPFRAKQVYLRFQIRSIPEG
jgi:hypothetical protein